MFEEARRAATWHYQHIVLREFLPGLIGGELAADLREQGSRHYRITGEEPYISFEFADAAYRYGHAQIRQRYQVNRRFGPCPVFPDLIGFRPVSPGTRSIGHLTSTCPVIRRRSAPSGSTGGCRAR